MEPNIKPLKDRVVVKALPVEEKTAGGLIIPDSGKEKPVKGAVVAVNQFYENNEGIIVNMTVKKGDIVLYGKYSGTEVTVEGEEYLMMKESDIFAVLPPSTK